MAMLTSQGMPMRRMKLISVLLLILASILIVAIRRGYYQNLCEQNMKELLFTAESVCLERGLGVDDLVQIEWLRPYLSRKALACPISKEVYNAFSLSMGPSCGGGHRLSSEFMRDFRDHNKVGKVLKKKGVGQNMGAVDSVMLLGLRHSVSGAVARLHYSRSDKQFWVSLGETAQGIELVDVDFGAARALLRSGTNEYWCPVGARVVIPAP